MKKTPKSSRKSTRQHVLKIEPAWTITDLSADLCCHISHFLRLMTVSLTAPPASFRECNWKVHPTAMRKAIITAANDEVLFGTVLDKVCKERDAETTKL
jgi:hypothetical protein